MEITTEQYNRIQYFLDAEMTIEEMVAFEIELEANPYMRTQLDFEQSIRDNFYTQQIDTSFVNKKKVIPINNNRKKWLGIAAATLLIAIAAIFFLNTKNNTPTIVAKKNDAIKTEKIDTQALPKILPSKIKGETDFAELFEQYFEPDKVPETYPIQLAEAFNGYEKGNYSVIEKLDADAVANSRGIEDKQSILETLHYYKGIAFLKNNNTGQALVNLQWVLQNSSNDTLKANANWYLGLGYLKRGELGKAKRLFNGIGNYGRYKKEIIAILRTLDI